MSQYNAPLFFTQTQTKGYPLCLGPCKFLNVGNLCDSLFGSVKCAPPFFTQTQKDGIPLFLSPCGFRNVRDGMSSESVKWGPFFAHTQTKEYPPFTGPVQISELWGFPTALFWVGKMRPVFFYYADSDRGIFTFVRSCVNF